MAAMVTEVARRKFARDPRDFYAEDPRASRLLFRSERFIGRVLDPAAGRGTIIDEAKAAGHPTIASDVEDRGWGYRRHNFVDPSDRLAIPPCANIVTNPPFGLCDHRPYKPGAPADLPPGLPPFPFIRAALQFAALKVAMFLPSDYLTGINRNRFLDGSPLYRVYYIAPRPAIVPGNLIGPNREVDWQAAKSKGLTDFAWFVWKHGHVGPATVHFLDISQEQF